MLEGWGWEEPIVRILTAVGVGMMLGTELLWASLWGFFVHGLKREPKKCYRKTRQRKLVGITLTIFGIVVLLPTGPVFLFDLMVFAVVLPHHLRYLLIPFGGLGMGIGLTIFGFLLLTIGNDLREEMDQNSS